MPTDGEFKELINNCQCEWMKYKGVKGSKFTSKKTGYTDKWIFLPAAGSRYNDRLDDVGSSGIYWSSSLDTDYPYYAYLFYFYSYRVGTDYSYRSGGISVRPVTD